MRTDAIVKERTALKMEVQRMRAYMKKDLIQGAGYVFFHAQTLLVSFYLIFIRTDAPSDKELALSNYLTKMVEQRKLELQSITKPLKAARPKVAKSLDGMINNPLFSSTLTNVSRSWSSIETTHSNSR